LQIHIEVDELKRWSLENWVRWAQRRAEFRALAFWRNRPARATYRVRPIRRRRDASGFVAMVVDQANLLPLK
jgi:hypothetical protein